jgi:hypothetical protein
MNSHFSKQAFEYFYTVLDVKAVGEQLFNDAVSTTVTIDHNNRFTMRFEVESDAKGPHAYNVTEHLIVDSRQNWRSTSAGPLCWLRMNNKPITNDLIRSFTKLRCNNLKTSYQ